MKFDLYDWTLFIGGTTLGCGIFAVIALFTGSSIVSGFLGVATGSAMVAFFLGNKR